MEKEPEMPRRMIARPIAVSVWLAASVLSLGKPASAETFLSPGFASQVVATLPPFTAMGMAFAPDGRLFVWQKNGVVRIIKNGTLLPTPFIDLSAEVNTYNDRGLWGLALHPDFASNGYVYMTYTFEHAGNPNDFSSRTSRLIRVTADPANPDVVIPGSQVVILGTVGTPPCSAHPKDADCIASDSGIHELGALHFALDGTLFVGVGDGANNPAPDPNALRAQDLDSPNGKILRIRTDGTAPPDNPFYDGTDSWRSKVWQYGLRNPFNFSVHSVTGEVILGDVGWNDWEEINQGPPGANFGWPCYEGQGPQPGYQAQFPECAQLPASAVTAPFFGYHHSTGGCAVILGPFYTFTRYPSEYWGNLFYLDYNAGWIQRVVFDAQHRFVSVQPFADFVDGPVALALGPDGMLYYLSFPTGEVRRIQYNGPVAVASASPTEGYSPLTVAFSSVGSTDTGGGTLGYLWAFGDGTTSTSANPNHTYTANSVTWYTAQLTVTNSAGGTATDVVDVVVGSVPPTPTILSPADDTTVLPGQTVAFQGSATDADDGLLPAAALTWTVLLHHNTHVHTFVGGTGSSGSFVAENHGTVGTFSYEIVLTATDSSGLRSATSVTLPVGADTAPPTPPSALTATANGFLQVDLGWLGSTDNGGVAGYRVERCEGAGCTNFAQVAASTGTAPSDIQLNPGTTYRYRVRAIDASGNLSGYSDVVTVTTPAVPNLPPGLVGAWPFGEGAGATTADVSGNGNRGTIDRATWTPHGRHGSALGFNGENSTVRVPASASLDLSSAMTMSAWIQPTASQSSWRSIVQKEADAYFLHGSSDGPLRPAGGGTVGGDVNYVSGPTAIPVNTWTHVALSYDGATLRLYVNGTQVATRAAGGPIQATTNPLWIGSNTYGEDFQGLIDEVRIYNRALTQAEIQSDMANPILPTALDTTPPSTPTGLSATAVGGSQINLSWTASTDNVGVAGYRVERCQSADCTNFAQVATPAGATYNDTGLAPSTTYRYQVRAIDGAGNLSPYSEIASATTPAAPDTTPPTAPTGLTAVGISTTRIDVSWTASNDNVGVTEYRVERCQGAACTNFTQIGTSVGTTFSNTGLAPSTTYRYRVRAVDAAGNLSPYSPIASAATPAPPDTIPPTAPTGLTAVAISATRIDLTWTASTDDVGVAGYRVERCQGASCTNFTQVGTPVGTTFSNTGLASSTAYRYQVRAVDAAGNLSLYSAIASATTPAAPDTTPPTAPTGLTAVAISTTRIDLTWAASTDNVGVTEYRVERCQGGNCTNFAQIGTTASASFSSTGLSPNTNYRFRVRAADGAGNVSPYSAIVTRRTLAPDTSNPTAPSGLTATAVSPTQINLGWIASTDNVGVTGYRVERCQTATCTNFVEVGTSEVASFSDAGRLPGTTYRYRVRAYDAAGNLSTYSNIGAVTTPAVPDTSPPTAPTSLTATPAGSSQVGLGWVASTDDVGVAGYRVERCQSEGCTAFAEVAAPTGTSLTDGGLSPSTAYRYRVRAVDPSGNLSDYSEIAEATTGAAPPTPPGLVGAWAFGEGTGTTTADASGNANTGTITAAAWTQGRYGNGLSFNGINSMVQVAASASLNLTSGMTLSAWVQPTASQSSWRTIVQKQSDAYFLHASSEAPLRPAGGGTMGGDVNYVIGPTAIPVNTWTHVALTYDGATLRLYVNGTQVATRAAGGSIQTTTNPLWIGSNTYGERFQGLIDEVRVYNRALTPTEIQTDMATPIPGG
jgi:glucose/arabinose dehydrogenase/predicted phage tail protein